MAEFIERECEFSDVDENEIITCETQSDRDFLDNESLDSDARLSVSDFRRIDNSEFMRYRKVGCKFCGKLISATNLKKHKRICFPKHKQCTYTNEQDGKTFECLAWVNLKNYDEHLKNHTGSKCTICHKFVLYADKFEHEVACRLKDLETTSLNNKLLSLEKEYETNYLVWCKDNDKHAKSFSRWIEDKFAKKMITEAELKFCKEREKPKKPNKENTNKTAPTKDKENSAPPAPPEQTKKKAKTCKSDDEQKKPSENFQCTFHLKYTWIYTTLIKYLLSTFFDGYTIPCRFKKTWPVGCGSTTLFPYPDRWSRMQRTALQKKNKLRNQLRQRVAITRKKLDWEYTKLKYYDYNLNPRRYFRKQFIKPISFIQEFISGKEYGLNAALHCHFYIKTKKPMYINTLRRFFRRFKFKGTSLLEHIATVRSPKEWKKYCTKEDYNAIIRNVDSEKAHNNYIMWNFAKLSRSCNISMYSVYRWQTIGQMNKYRDIHAAYWEPIIKREAYERAMAALEETERDDIEDIAKLLLLQPKKGIYLHGDPKTGKSTTALAITKGAHFQVPEGNSTFAFHSWKNEPFILFEDISNVDFLHFRNKVNQLCDEHGLCFAQTKGGGSKLITCSKLIVTSNFLPPTEVDWPGFERRFICIKYDTQSVTKDQLL